MHLSAPEESAGFSRFEASSVPPEALPAPISVWISSMKRIALGLSTQLLQHRLQALLEVAAVLGAGQQRAHVERVDLRLGEDLGHLAVDHALGEALGDGGLAHAGLAHQQRVVLAPAAEDLDHALELGLAADERVDLAVDGELVQVLREALERAAGLGLRAPPARPRLPRARPAPAAPW